MSVKVILDAYAGWTEPEWFLPKADIEEIKNKLKDLPIARPNVVNKHLADLDYRGFILYNVKEPNFPERMQVTRSYIVISKDNKKIYEKDTKGIEELLLKQAIKKGYGDVIAEVNQTKIQSEPIKEHKHEHTVMID